MIERLALHGLVLEVSAHDGHRLDRLLAVLRHFGATPSHDVHHIAIALCGGPPRPPTTALTVRHLDLGLGTDGNGFHVHGPALSAHLDASARRTVIHADHDIPVHVLTCMLVHQLRRWGADALHAAAVAQEGQGVLIAGPSGAGKSTLTRALAQNGWDLVSDDSILLRAAEGTHRALALRRGIYLRPDEVTLPPGASWRPCPLLEGSKQELVLPDLPRAAEAEPRLLLLPTRHGGPHTSFTPADPDEALWWLAAESRLAELDPTGTPDHLLRLASLAGSVSVHHAHLGLDVLDAPDTVSRRLRALLPGPRPLAPARPWLPPGPSPAPSAHAPFAPTASGGLLLHPVTFEAFALDPAAAALWMLSRSIPPAGLAAAFGAAHQLPAEIAQDHVQHFLQTMQSLDVPLPEITS